MIHPLTAISPLDGRYAQQTLPLQTLVSEFGLIHHRVIVEIDWLITLANDPKLPEIKPLNAEQLSYLHNLINEFKIDDAMRIKTIEETTRHDVKAVEYYLQEAFRKGPELETYIPFIHFACTSEDINNVAYALMLRKTRDMIILPKLTEIMLFLDQMALRYAKIPMLSRTHGQYATPTTLGKEMRVFAERLKQQIILLQHIAIRAKFNGAVGNFNAHHAAYPEVNWPALSKHFIESLSLTDNPYTTQIEPHDFIAEFMHALSRTHTILIDLCRDFWGYISHHYFTQLKVAGEVGSSTMPHKVNPIHFENAEGNLGIANALAGHLADKLPISRWQCDLSDSTVLRNLGSVLGYALISYIAIETGLTKLDVNEAAIAADLAPRWELMAEPIQTVLRRYGIADAYEQLKALTRGNTITPAEIQTFIEGLAIPEVAKTALQALTPETYIGYAAQLAQKNLETED